MVTAGFLQMTAALCMGWSGAWIDESFEGYQTHVDLCTAWPIEGKHQDGRLSDIQCAGPGKYSLSELPGEDSRHVKVFEPGNSVDGTDEKPLVLSYDLFIDNRPPNCYRYCELLNTETGDRIAVGPSTLNTYYQIFDGVRWRDLAYAPERTTGWNQFELTIKTDVLSVRVYNSKGRSCEEVPRENHSGFGAIALGSGRANRKAVSYLDNVRLAGGVVRRSGAAGFGERSFSPSDLSLLRRTNAALQALYHRKPSEIRTELEGLLSEAERGIEAGQCSVGVLPWIYEAVATIKGPEAPHEILEAIHYEAIERSPDGFGVEASVRGLASLLIEPMRTELLLNVARKYRTAGAGWAAARMLVELPDQESAQRKVKRYSDLIDRAADTDVPLAAVRSSCLKTATEIWSRQMPYQVVYLDKEPMGPELLRRCSDRLLSEERWEQVRELTDALADRASPLYEPVVRKMLFRARMELGDVWGGLAAISDRPIESGRGQLLEDLAGMEDPTAIRRCLSDLVSRAVKIGGFAQVLPADALVRDAPEPLIWQSIAAAGERAGLPKVALVAYQVLGRAAQPLAASDGSLLSEDFALSDGPLDQVAQYWKAQYFISRERSWEADGLLAELVQSAKPMLRAQAAHDLASIRQKQHRPGCATQPAAVCRELLPASQVVKELQASIDQDLRRQEGRQRLHAEVGRAWGRADPAPDAEQAAGALMEAAEWEGRLGVPERAVEALEALIAKYPNVPVLPAAIEQLAAIYKDALARPDKSRALLDRLARDYPDRAAVLKTGS